MSNNTKRCLLLGAMVAIALALLFWFRHRQDAGSRLVATGQQGGLATNPATAAAADPWPQPAGVDDTGWNYLLTIRRYLLSRNQPVSFYARAVDQDGHQVSDVEMRLALAYVDTAKVLSPAFLRSKMGDEQVKKRITLKSDSRGWLRLEGEMGYSVRIESVSKTGYLWHEPSRLGSFLYEADERARVHPDMQGGYDATTGYTVHLWRKGPTEPLVLVNRWLKLGTNTHSRLMNLFRADDSAQASDLRIKVEYTSPDEPDHQYDQRITIEVLNGGLHETSDVYPYAASVSGYVAEFTFLYRPGDKQTGAGWERRFYASLRDGQMHGGFVVKFVPAPNKGLEITGFLNPSGFRVLEPDPSKLITDPDEIRRLDEATRVK